MKTEETKSQSEFASIFSDDANRQNANFGEVEKVKTGEALDKVLFERKGVRIIAVIDSISSIYDKMTENGERQKVAVNLLQFVPSTDNDGKETKSNTIFLYVSQMKAILATSGFSFVDALFKNRDTANFLKGTAISICCDKATANVPYIFADTEKSFTFPNDRYIYYVTKATKGNKIKEFEKVGLMSAFM